MTNYKTLASIVAGALTLGSCSHNNQLFHYNGTIGREKVQFYELNSTKFKDINVLKIVREDGTEIVMKDFNGDLNIDEVTINKDGVIVQYRKGRLGEKVIQEAQNQFKIYMKGIDDQSIEILTESTGANNHSEEKKKSTGIILNPIE
ncbi:MAG: hypothetical protein Q8R37_02725 [Nanoarchaeota archaeon]|nr:hypothetical protein [Nanoarchaeota archaeon]